MREVGGPGVGEVLEAVVALVGQREAALQEERHVPLRVAGVGLDVEVDDAADAVALEGADDAQERGDVGDAVDRRELLGERGGAERGDALGVHEARVEVADLARLGAGLEGLRLLHDRAHVLLGLLGDQVERAPAGLVLGDLGAFDPVAVDMAEEVVLRADLSAQLVECETGSGVSGHALQDMRRAGPSDSLGRAPVRSRGLNRLGGCDGRADAGSGLNRDILRLAVPALGRARRRAALPDRGCRARRAPGRRAARRPRHRLRDPADDRRPDGVPRVLDHTGRRAAARRRRSVAGGFGRHRRHVAGARASAPSWPSPATSRRRSSWASSGRRPR